LKILNENSTKNEDLIPVILSGGSGTRLWPLSRKTYPKQYINLSDENNFSLLQNTYLRLRGINKLRDPIIISNQAQRFLVAEQMREINVNPHSILLEPFGKNTAAAITLAALRATDRNTDPTLLVLSSDHKIDDEEAFRKVIEDGLILSDKGRLVTFGIVPYGPETGFGYIKSFQELSKKNPTSKIEKFVEKPNHHKAVQYLNDGSFRWNAGMFVFSFGTIKKSLLKHQKKLHKACEQWFKIADKPLKLKRRLKKDYPKLDNISFDYGIMEHAKNTLIVDGDFEWDDLGSWPALSRHLKSDSEGNCSEGDPVYVDAARNIVFDARLKKNRKPIAIVGLRDCVIVQTDDTSLFAHKKATPKMRDLILKITRSKSHKHLI